MATGLRDRAFSKAWWISYIRIVVGCFLLAAGFVLFVSPYKIVPGGVYGMGIVLHHLFPGIQVGTFGFMFDIPLLLLSFLIFGGIFGSRTVVAAVITPLMMNTMTWFVGEDPSSMFGGRIDFSNDMIIACIFGGIFIGAGVGLVVKSRATTGGTDIVAMTLSKYSRIAFSRCILIVDSAVVIFGMLVLGDWRIPLFSLITIYVSARVIDYVIDGASYDKLLFIISDRHDELREFILESMGRGATYIRSAGMYTRREKEMIFLVVSRREVSTVQQKVKEIDPLAFMVVVNAYETFGDGFKAFPEKE